MVALVQTVAQGSVLSLPDFRAKLCLLQAIKPHVKPLNFAQVYALLVQRQ